MKPAAESWTYIGLLTDEQKRARLFVSQDEDFIWLCQANGSGGARILAVFPYETATVKEIRDMAQQFRLRDVQGEENPLTADLAGV